MKTKASWAVVWLFILVAMIRPLAAFAQAGPQAQDCRTALWANVQADQALRKNWTWTTILAYSQRSADTKLNPLEHFGVLCFRQEMAKRFSKNLRLSIGSFYSAIGTNGLSESPQPAYLNELRLYPRLYFDVERPKWRLSTQLRLDTRYFFGPLFEPVARPYQLRVRLSARAFVPLDVQHRFTLIANSEFFASTDYQSPTASKPGYWSEMKVRENRSWLFMRTKISEMFSFDLGVMVQTRLPYNDFADDMAFYGAVGLIIRNPFGSPKEKDNSDSTIDIDSQ